MPSTWPFSAVEIDFSQVLCMEQMKNLSGTSCSISLYSSSTPSSLHPSSLSPSLSLCYTYHSPPSCFSLTQGNHFTQINNKPPILTTSHKQINNGFFRRWLRHHLDTWDADYRTGDETAYKYRNATHTEKLPSNNIYFLMCKFRHCAGVLKKCWIQTFRKCKNWNPSC